MKKLARKSEYHGSSKGLKLMLLMMIAVVALFCLSACITIQVPDKSSNNKDNQTEQQKTGDAQTEEQGTRDAQNNEPSSGGSSNNNSGSDSSQKKSQGTSDTQKKSQGSTETPKNSSGSSAASSDSGKSSGSGGSATGNSGKSSGISEEEAINIALSRVKGATRNDIISFKSEYDDGRLEYEGKIKKNGVIYEFEIDGVTGNILDWEIDDD